MSEIKLLPCPFCGAKAKQVMLLGRNGVACKDCLCEIRGWLDSTQEDVAKAWNTRKPMERIVEQIDDLETYYDNGDFATCGDRLVVLKDVLQIVKEEGGIDAE